MERKFKLLWLILDAIGQIFIAVNSKKIEQAVYPSGHTAAANTQFLMHLWANVFFGSIGQFVQTLTVLYQLAKIMSLW